MFWPSKLIEISCTSCFALCWRCLHAFWRPGVGGGLGIRIRDLHSVLVVKFAFSEMFHGRTISATDQCHPRSRCATTSTARGNVMGGPKSAGPPTPVPAFLPHFPELKQVQSRGAGGPDEGEAALATEEATRLGLKAKAVLLKQLAEFTRKVEATSPAVVCAALPLPLRRRYKGLLDLQSPALMRAVVALGVTGIALHLREVEGNKSADYEQ